MQGAALATARHPRLTRFRRFLAGATDAGAADGATHTRDSRGACLAERGAASPTRDSGPAASA